MFYKMIENKCKEWYASEQCTVHNLIEYIEKTGQMRDAQIEAIKVYLFLKITLSQNVISLYAVALALAAKGGDPFEL